MIEFGIFGDGGLLEGEFYDDEIEARRVLAARYSEDAAHVAECCPDHPEHERETCEQCDEDSGSR